MTMGRDVTILATDVSAGRPRPRPRERRRPRGRGRDAVRRGRPAAGVLPDDGAPFDVVLANLPYVRTDAIDGLPIAASFEPRAGARRRAGRARRHPGAARPPADALAADGVALLEIGADQGESAPAAVAARAARAGRRRSSRTSPACRGSSASSARRGRRWLSARPGEPRDRGRRCRPAPRSRSGCRARHRRHARRRRPRHRTANPGRDPRRDGRAASRSSLVTGPDGDQRPAVRPDRSASIEPIVGYQGALIRALPPRRRRPAARAAPRPHARCAAAAAREVDRLVARRVGLEPAPQPPRAVRRPGRRPARRGLLGVPRRAGRARRPDLAAWIRQPVSKVLAVGARPDPRADDAPTPRRRFAGRADVTLSHPRFLEFLAPGRLEGPRRPLAGAPRPASRSAQTSWRSATSSTTSRCSPRSATAPRCRRAPDGGPGGRPLRRAAGRRGGRRRPDRAARAGLAAPTRPGRAARAGAASTTPRSCAGDRPHDAPGSSPTTPPAGPRPIEVLRAGGIVALPTDTVYGIAVALDDAGRDRGAVRGQATGRRTRAIMLLLADAAQAPAIGAVAAGRGRARRRVLAGRPDARRAAAAGRRAAGRR